MSERVKGGMLESERALQQYSDCLKRFDGDPRVAEDLVAVQRILLFRARAYTDETVAGLLDSIAGAAERHRGELSVQRGAASAMMVALAAIAKERLGEALSHYSRLQQRMQQGDATDAETQASLCSALGFLMNELSGPFPAVAFALWNDAAELAAKAPAALKWSTWITFAADTASRLAPNDALAALGVWTQAVDWSREEGFVPEAAVALVEAAYRIVRLDPVAGRPVNEILWRYVASADAARSGDGGGHARMMSLLAAVDMVQYLAAGAAQARITEVVATARAWLGEELVRDTNWTMLTSSVQKASLGPAASNPEFQAFARIVGDLALATRRLHAAAARAEVRLIEGAPSAWVDTPLAPAVWTEIEDAETFRDVAAHLIAVGGPMQGRKIEFERLRSAVPSFYPRAVLYEVQARTPEQGTGVVFFALLANGEAAVFDGKSQPIHNINGQGFLENMNEPAVVIEYLDFFCHAVWGLDGPFRVTRSVEQLPSPPPQALADHLRTLLVAEPTPIRQSDSTWHVAATVQYGEALYRSVFQLKANGEVAMINDQGLLGGLPWKKLTIDGLLRQVVDATEPNAQEQSASEPG